MGATRIALGVLWLHEGIFKYSAHFGSADILLVVDGARSNSRVPEYFKLLSDGLLSSWPGLFGYAIPLLETVLGVALTLGILTFPAALGSLITLMTYWSSDQLITQYPLMAALSALTIGWPAAASRFSITTLVADMRRRRHTAGSLISGHSHG